MVAEYCMQYEEDLSLLYSYIVERLLQCFTMDETRTKAVIEAFVRLNKEGLIYRLFYFLIYFLF